MKLVEACISARKDRESSFHQCEARAGLFKRGKGTR